MEQGLKILSLTTENVKKLVAVRIVPKGNLVMLTGGNGEGKTSVMDCISWAFEGKAKIQKCPIRFGENKAWIEIDLDKYLVRRTFKLDKNGVDYDTTITVTSKDGSEFKSPQALLDTVFGSLAFDPLAFSRASAKDQVASLESLVKDFDFAKSRTEEELAYNERTIVNRKVKDASQTHISFKDVPVPEPEKVDIKDLTQKLAEAGEANTERQRIISEKDSSIDKATKEVNDLESSILTTEAELLELQKEIEDKKDLITRWRSAKTYAENVKRTAQSIQIPKEVDATAIKTKLDDAQTKNALHEQWVKKSEAGKLVQKFEAESKTLTEKIEGIQQARRDAVAGAQIPVEGLGFDENGVTLNTVPFEQCSSGEKLKTSVILAMLSNPTLRVIRVADGSLLDEKGMDLLAQLAIEKDYQIWVEKTDTSGKIGIVLESGKVKE